MPYIIPSDDFLVFEIHQLLAQVNGVHHYLVGSGASIPNFFPAPLDGARGVHTWDKEMQASAPKAIVRSACAMKFTETLHYHHRLVLDHFAGAARDEYKNLHRHACT